MGRKERRELEEKWEKYAVKRSSEKRKNKVMPKIKNKIKTLKRGSYLCSQNLHDPSIFL